MYVWQNPSDEQLRQAAPRSCRDGKIVFSCCRLCGALDWVSTTKEDDSVEVVESEMYCDYCGDAQQRNPEIMQAVASAIENLRWKMRKQTVDSRA